MFFRGIVKYWGYNEISGVSYAFGADDFRSLIDFNPDRFNTTGITVTLPMWF